MEIIGYLLAIIIGITMGLIGGGGSILSVPVFVYLFKMDAVTATAFSLFVVGTTSAVGTFGYFRNKLVDLKTALLFGIPSVISVIFVRKLVLPYIPSVIFTAGNFSLSKDVLLLVMFAVLMLFSSIKMIWGTEKIDAQKDKPQYTLLVTQGIAVGMITGMIGAGGGFLIVPALVMLLGLEMKKAVGTSLFIIALNSVLGFFSSISHIQVDWTFLMIFTSLSIVGIFVGVYLSRKTDGKKLKPAFGWFVLAMGIYILVKEIFFS